MKYRIEAGDLVGKYLKVILEIVITGEKAIKLQLPAWRPGRYQIQNFAKNIRNFSVINSRDEKIAHWKTSKDSWSIAKVSNEQLTVSYEYYANQQDAGGSYIDKEMLYVNPINLLMYQPGLENEACELMVDFAQNSQVACGLRHTKNKKQVHFHANSYHELVDSPLIISDTLQQHTYFVDKIPFHIWVQGKVDYPWARILKDFEAFTRKQLEIFKEFPVVDYHFMLWVPIHPYYHGVEHGNSTMMVLGPDSQAFEDMYLDLLGLSSHELFHTWNIKKIRPEALLPYKYDRENYFDTCFIAEGFTTFYGDWILHRAGILNKQEFQKELETTLRRHFDNADNSTLSLLESSFDLWLDGYEAGAPNRKVSVYHKGAVATLILNHQLKAFIDHPYPMDLVMQELWTQYGKTEVGYSYNKFKKLIRKISNNALQDYFATVIEGNISLFALAQSAVEDLGFILERNTEGRTILKEKN
jgi:predicted metalloprotease with PDZ domain